MHEPGQLQVLADHRPLPGPAAAQPHPHVLLPGRELRRSLVLEPAQPGHRRLQPGGHVGVVGGLLAQGADQLLELLVLLVPPPPQLIEPLIAVPPGLRVAGEPAAVHPDAAVLDGDDPPCGVGQQLPVVADQQDGLACLGQLLFQPELARHVQVVVRLVEQQDLGRAAQQRLQHEPLLLAAGQRAHAPVAALLVAEAERGDRARVPQHLGLVPARVAPVRQRRRVPQLGRLAVPRPHRVFRRVQPRCGLAHPLFRNENQQVADHRLRARSPEGVLDLGAVPPDPPDALLADALLARGDTLLAPIGPDPPDALLARGRPPVPPINCRITPSPPLEVTVPDCGITSPAMSRISVVLPAPFGPTSAATVPSPTRKEASSSSTRPSGSACCTCATSTCPTLIPSRPRAMPSAEVTRRRPGPQRIYQRPAWQARALRIAYQPNKETPGTVNNSYVRPIPFTTAAILTA